MSTQITSNWISSVLKEKIHYVSFTRFSMNFYTCGVTFLLLEKLTANYIVWQHKVEECGDFCKIKRIRLILL